jgi:TonB family protein
MTALLLAALTLAVPPAEAPSTAEAPPASGVLTRAPALEHFVEAEYPPEALAAGISGSVQLSLVVDERGQVTQATVVEPGPSPAFAAAALHAVSQFVFSPAEIDGKPAAVEITYRYDFVLKREARPAPEAPVVLLGRVLERGTRSPVPGAVIEAGGSVAEADAEGRFALRGVVPGTVTVKVFSPSHEPFTAQEVVEAGKVREVEYRLRRRHYDPFEAVVQGERERREVAVHSLRLEEVRSLPGTQGDTLKVVQNLPGVARAPYGLGLLVVRGSAPQDTKVLADGVEIPILFHFGGLTSVIASETLSQLDFYPGNFGARYGRATGGAIDVGTRDGRPELHGLARLDIFDGQFLLEGPLGKGSFLVSARRSWVDAVLALVLPSVAPDAARDLRVAPRYYDYQLKYSQPLWGGTGSVFAYGSDDALAFVTQTTTGDRPTLSFATTFHRLGARWEGALGERLRNRGVLAVGYDRFDVSQGNDFGVLSDVASVTLRDAFIVRAAEGLSLELGADALLRRFRYSIYAPPVQAPGTVGGPLGGDTATRIGEQADGGWLAPGLYAEADWRPFPWLKVVPGLRLDADSRLRHDRVWVDPRLTTLVTLTEGTSLAAGIGLYRGAPQPQETTRLFGNPDLGTSRAVHYSLGVVQDLPWSSRLEVTAFAKTLRDLVVPTRALDAQGNLLHLSNGGIGEVYGVEMLLRRDLAKGLFGWIAYTLSKSIRRDDSTIPGYPAWHPFALDQTHILTLVLSWRLPGDYILGTRLRAVSGNPYTPFVGQVLDADTGRYRCLASSRTLSARVPGFFQADARIDKRWVFEGWMFSAYLDVQNVTNRSNAEFRFPNYDCTEQVFVPGLPFFPAFGLKAEW